MASSVTAWRTDVLIRCFLQPSLAEALPWCYLCLLHTDRTSPEVRMCGWLRLSPHGALTCLYGVTYSRASPMLFPWCYLRLLHPDRTSPRCECRRWLSCHRMAHFVLIRCYLQPSLAEALPWCYLCLLHTDRTSPRCECVLEGFVCHRMAHLRAYTVLLTAEPLRCSTLVLSSSATYRPHTLRGASVCWRVSSATAWRTYVLIRCYLQPSLSDALSLVLSSSATYGPHLPEVRMCVGGLRLSPHGALTCLYGVTYSRASPRLFLGVIFFSNSLMVITSGRFGL